MGIEPKHVGTTNRCVNHFTTTAMAGVEGIEPPPTVLETVVLPLNYTPIMECIIKFQWRGRESNPRHYELQSYALPTELPSHLTVTTGFEPVIFRVTGERPNQLDHATNGRYRDRTCDPLLVRQVLSQLS